MQDPSSYSQIKAPPQFPEQEHLKCPRCESLNTKFCYYNNYNLSQPRHFCKNCRRYWTKGGTLRNIPVGGGSRKNTKRSSNTKRASSSTPSSSNNTIPLAAVAAAQPPKQEQEQQQEEVRPLCDNNNNNNNNSGAVLLFDQQDPCALDHNQERHPALLEIGGSFSSLLEGNGQFGDWFEGLNSSKARRFQLGEFAENLKNSGLGSNLMPSPIVEFQGNKNSDGFFGGQNGGDTSCWSNTNVNGWPDLSINTPTPGSSSQ